MADQNQDGAQLKLRVRTVIWNCIEELQEQFNASKDDDERERIDAEIKEFMGQLSVLRAQSLQALHDSHEVRQAVAEIESITEELNDEADNVNTVEDALNRGAAMVEKATKVVGQLASLATAS